MEIIASSTTDDNRTWFTVAFDRRIGADTEAYRWLMSQMKGKVFEHEDGPTELGKYFYMIEVSEDAIDQMKEAYEACLSDSITRH